MVLCTIKPVSTGAFLFVTYIRTIKILNRMFALNVVNYDGWASIKMF
jgi:hypothetical protein